MATSGEESDMATSSEMLESAGNEKAPPIKKKKGFIKKVKYFFRRRSKKEDEPVVGIKAKSTSQLSDTKHDDDGTGSDLSETKPLSMSADSVFAQDQQKNANASLQPSTSKSLSKQAFTAELSSKIRARRSDDEEEDEGLAPSPVTTTTADVLENGLKEGNKDSDMSFGSMDSLENEVEEDFFNKRWTYTPSLSNKELSSGLTPSSDVDLNVVASAGNLNVAAQKHKISVGRQQGKRSASHHQRRRTNSPNPPTCSSPVLQIVEEDIEIKEPEPAPKEEVKVVDPSPEPVVEDAKKETAVEEKETKDEPVKETKPETSGVVLRKNRDSGVDADSSKRQTFAGSETTIFGERKVLKRASFNEAQNWEELDKGKEKPTTETTDSGTSEFSQMFSKLRSRPSQRLQKLEAAEQKKGTSILGSGAKKEPNTKVEPTKSVPQATKATVVKPVKEVEKPSEKKETIVIDKKPVETKKETIVIDKKTTETKKETIVIDKKPTETKKETVVIDKKPVETKKEAVVDKKPTETKKETIVIDKKPAETKKEKLVIEKKPVETKKEVLIIEKKPLEQKKEVQQTNAPSESESKVKSEPTKTVTLNTATSNATKSETSTQKVEESPKSFKRDSPLSKDRNRSQTLPDQPNVKTSPKPVQSSPSPSVKRAKTFGAADTKDSSEPAGGGGQPSWIAMARRKTRNWGDSEKEVEEKENKYYKKDEESGDLESRKSKVLDMVKLYSNG